MTEEIQTTPPTATSSRPKPRWHGDFALFPAGTLYESIDLEPGAVPEALARVEITSEDIERYASFGDVPADVRDEARSPDYIPAGVQLDSVRVLAEGGSLLQSTALWFNDSTFRRDLAHADLAVTRTLAMQPPVVVVLPGPQPDGGRHPVMDH